MAGLLKMPAPGAGKITPDMLRAKMHVGPQQGRQLDRMVLAGLKVMFSKQSHHMMMEVMNGPDPAAYKLSQGVCGLLGLLMRESKNSLPPNLLVPAGMILMAHAAEFLRKSGEEVSDKDIGDGIQMMTNTLLHSAGLSGDKVAAAGAKGMGKAAQPAPRASAAPVAPGGAAQ